MFGKQNKQQSISDIVAMVVPLSRLISICMLLICKNDLACTVTQTDESAVDGIVATMADNDVEDGLENFDQLHDTPIKLGRIGSAVELLSSIARV